MISFKEMKSYNVCSCIKKSINNILKTFYYNSYSFYSLFFFSILSLTFIILKNTVIATRTRKTPLEERKTFSAFREAVRIMIDGCCNEKNFRRLERGIANLLFVARYLTESIRLRESVG